MSVTELTARKPRGILQPRDGDAVEIVECPKCGNWHAPGDCMFTEPRQVLPMSGEQS